MEIFDITIEYYNVKKEQGVGRLEISINDYDYLTILGEGKKCLTQAPSARFDWSRRETPTSIRVSRS